MQNPNQNPNRNFLRSTLIYILGFLAIAGLFQLFSGSVVTGNVKKISSSEFVTQLEEGKLSEVQLQIGAGVYNVTGKYEKGTVKNDTENFLQIFQGSSNAQSFETKILGNDATLKQITDLAKESDTKLTTIPESSVGMWINLIPFLIMIPGFIMIFQMMQGAGGGGGPRGMMNFGKSKSKDVSKEKVKVRFTDVAGAEEEKQELEEVVEFLKDSKRFRELGARIPAGVLLEGPPGTGKTLLAKAVAGEAGVPFFSISGSEFVEMFVGVGASRVRDLFDNAKRNAPAIVFIDEIDAVGRRRGVGLGGGNDEREQTLNQLLVEMDGFSGNGEIIVIAATNRADVLDPALLRPGRFDRQILVGNPDVKGRESILKVHARNKKFASDVTLSQIAQQTPGFSGADLENLLNEAALVAARRKHKVIEAEDLDEAHDRVIAGPAKKDKVMSDKQRRTVAYHEAGHTVVGMVLSDAREVHKVTIVPRGKAGGYAIMLPKEDQFIVTREELYQQIVGLLGGRAAEEIVFNTQSTGASNDFQQATAIARSMVTEYGMSDKMGTVQYEGNHSMRGAGVAYSEKPAISEQFAFEIDTEVRLLMAKAHQEATDIINEHREQLNLIAEKLLEIETLDKHVIKALFETGEMPVETLAEILDEAERTVSEATQSSDYSDADKAPSTVHDATNANAEAQDTQALSDTSASRVEEALEKGQDLIAKDETQQ